MWTTPAGASVTGSGEASVEAGLGFIRMTQAARGEKHVVLVALATSVLGAVLGYHQGYLRP